MRCLVRSHSGGRSASCNPDHVSSLSIDTGSAAEGSVASTGSAVSAMSVDDRGLTDKANPLPARKFAAHQHTFYASAPFFHHSGLS